MEVTTPDYGLLVTNEALRLIKANNWDNEDTEAADLIIRVSNILYNNTSAVVLPLDDGIYDQLIVKLRYYKPDYQVGAEPIEFNEIPTNEIEDIKQLYTVVTEEQKDSRLFIRDIHKQHTPVYPMRPKTMYTLVREPISKRLINTEHKYPELVGTLDKCKFVLNQDAIEREAFDNPSVQVFERDYIHPCLGSGVIQPNEIFEMVGELKYDGVSVEAEVLGDRIISALSRGDTGENIATDLTPIFQNYRFYNAGKVPTDIPFGIKFEAVITHRNLEILGQLRGKTYKNARNAIIGLLGSSDGYKYCDFITLIPLSTSMEMDRITELTFLNKYYNTGEYNRYCVFKGNYMEILYQVKQFTESAEILRPILPYMIDGVVISFVDENKIKLLGRVNSVNKYQMAIKFNPRKVRTIFLGYTYNIGKSGDVIPMVHFKPAEFIGTIHTKQTIHSFQRFNELKLIKGQEIDIDYVNDVISYVTKPDTELNRHLEATAVPEKFIEVCPFCGTPIQISESMKSAKCPNPYCCERRIFRMVDLIDRLGFKDFSEETVRALNLVDFVQLIRMDRKEIEKVLGPVTTEKFIAQQQALINDPIEDYKIMSALGFEGMADEKWKSIFKHYEFHVLAKMNTQQLYDALTPIPGIGEKTVQAIVEGFDIYAGDIDWIYNCMKIINYKDQGSKPRVVITGFRNDIMIEMINAFGFDCSDKYSLTKDTYVLLTNDKNSTSGKMQKAAKYGVKIMTPDEFFKAHGIEYKEF